MICVEKPSANPGSKSEITCPYVVQKSLNSCPKGGLSITGTVKLGIIVMNCFFYTSDKNELFLITN
jgi:hypothetical protein